MKFKALKKVPTPIGNESLRPRRSSTTTTSIRITLDPVVKNQARAVLKTQGLTVTEAVRQFLYHLSTTKELPEILHSPLPNATTLAAIEATRQGEGLESVTLEQLVAEWNED